MRVFAISPRAMILLKLSLTLMLFFRTRPFWKGVHCHQQRKWRYYGYERNSVATQRSQNAQVSNLTWRFTASWLVASIFGQRNVKFVLSFKFDKPLKGLKLIRDGSNIICLYLFTTRAIRQTKGVIASL